MKKIPLRRCVATNEQLPKKELLRIVKTPDDQIKVDLTGRLNGRGAYLKKDKDVILQAKKSKVLDKKLEVSVPLEIYDELLGLL